MQRLKEIPAQLASDPLKLAKELRTRAGRIDALRSTLLKASSALSDEAIEATKALAEDSATKMKAAQVAAKTNFADDPLQNIGEQVWRQLWEAARKYSEVSYPDRDFPVTDGDDAVCVLCQQPLGEDAKDRLNRFEQFVRDDSAQQAAKAKEALRNAVGKVEGLGLLGDALREQLKDVESGDKQLLPSVRGQLATLIRRLRAIKQGYQSGQWDFPLPGTLENIDTKLSTLVSSTNAKAVDVEKSADQEERQRLETELAELKAREWLATVLGDVKEHLDRLAQIDKLKKALKETRTNRTTIKSKELAKAYVTDQLRDAFATEIKKMQQGVRRLNVELVPTAGEFGSSYYRVQLVGASKADIGTIVSEGEHRCIALAGFLSELATEPCKSTVIFDDPVTSLDHHWRGCFAQRLVEEAADRQVIVFTHDIVFLHDLASGAEQNDVPIELRRVQSNRDSCGFVNDGLPWIAQKTLPRIDELEKRARATRSDFDAHNDDEYERSIGAVYNELRATVERAVEEKLFLGIVMRHQDYISLKYLKKVTAITTDHCERLQKLFQRCCDITSAHDRSSLRGFGVPSPDDALDDLRELRAIVDDLKDKQKAVS
ncbi:AAA family ATPase [Stratiformator vulcanicus]|uniref:AAA family ATPase n=1 Tax=Stratiformator vulcanicus TaxID=2527980 RepID=UPI00119F2122|nr:AAA family ATPase [Stratiformator vulcanicus]